MRAKNRSDTQNPLHSLRERTVQRATLVASSVGAVELQKCVSVGVKAVVIVGTQVLRRVLCCDL